MARERLLGGENDSDHEWRALAREAGVPEWEASELYRQASERTASDPWGVRATYLELLAQARSLGSAASSGVSPGKQTLSAGIGQPSRRSSRAAPGKGTTRMTMLASRSAAETASPAPGIPVLRRARSTPAEPVGAALEPVLACEGGEPLPEPLRRRLEARFGVNLGGVRIHTDDEAAAAAMTASARAFAVGEHVFFGRGEFVPEKDSGFELLAHEIAHVVQFYQGRVQRDGTPGLSRPGDPLEREAEQVSRAVAAAEHVSTSHEPLAATAMADAGAEGMGSDSTAGAGRHPGSTAGTLHEAARADSPKHGARVGDTVPEDHASVAQETLNPQNPQLTMPLRDPVIQGRFAETPQGRLSAAGTRVGIIQRAADESVQPAATPPAAAIDPPQPGIDKPGFIDSDDGSNIRTRPAELSGSKTLTAAPLPPATRVFVSGRHPQTTAWWYVTAFLPEAIIRGYVQGLRVATDLPEPTAKLYQIKSGDTAEGLAVKEFSSAVRDGHDLRYYENVLLYVNRKHDRAGVRGSYQDPGLFGGGANNVQLEAGRRIWLVSPAYARALEGVVPDGSLTGGAVAKVKRFAGHIEDLVKSVTESPSHLGEVAGEYAQAIRDHMVEIVGIVAGFIVAEAVSAFLAATPTGVGQIAAVVIQLGLAAFGAAGMVAAGVEALKHAEQWLTLAWTAQGKEAKIAAASKEFLKMLVSIAMAALSYLGVKGNMGKAAAIADSMPTMMPAFAVAGGGQIGGAGAATAVATGLPGPAGPVGTAMAMTAKDKGEGGGSDNGGGAKQGADNAASKQAAEKAAAEQAAKKHVHGGGLENDPQSPYLGKWDGGGVHEWDELQKICNRDGYRIKSVTEDSATGARRVVIERQGIDPKTKAPVRGNIRKTIYPKDLTPAEIDAAGEMAFKAALEKQPGTKLDPIGTLTKTDGTPTDGFFEATVKAGNPPREVKIQGWYNTAPDGSKMITSHTPAYRKDWPTIEPESY